MLSFFNFKFQTVSASAMNPCLSQICKNVHREETKCHFQLCLHRSKKSLHNCKRLLFPSISIRICMLLYRFWRNFESIETIEICKILRSWNLEKSSSLLQIQECCPDSWLAFGRMKCKILILSLLLLLLLLLLFFSWLLPIISMSIRKKMILMWVSILLNMANSCPYTANKVSYIAKTCPYILKDGEPPIKIIQDSR